MLGLILDQFLCGTRRQQIGTLAKHPFLSPPATLSPDETFSMYVQDTLRGSVMKSMPFFDQKQVGRLLDNLPQMDEGARTANDQVLMLLVSMCVLHQRFGLAV